jgi:hypothetical protein
VWLRRLGNFDFEFRDAGCRPGSGADPAFFFLALWRPQNVPRNRSTRLPAVLLHI